MEGSARRRYGCASSATRAQVGDDTSDVSETSGEERKDQEATEVHAGTLGRRSRWTEQQDPVKQLRRQEGKSLENKIDAPPRDALHR